MRIISIIWNMKKKKKQPIITTRRKKESPPNEDSISSLWNNFQRSNIHIIGVPEGEEKEQGAGNLFEKIMKENFPNSVKEIDMQVQEAQRVPNKMDAKRPTPRHMVIKIPKVKDKERIFFFSFTDLIYVFLERGEGREKERERNINVWLPLAHPCRGPGPQPRHVP